MRLLTTLASLAFGALAVGQTTAWRQYTWTYYRPGNTGMQGDICESVWIGPDGDPWVGGYDASFEEGGISKFLQSQNRWLNVSNVDYPVIGHPDRTGTARVSDIDTDAAGRLWMATGRGGLLYDPGVGPRSLRRFGDDNSPIPGGWNRGVEVAPDGTVWFSAYSTTWGTGGVARHNPANGQWTVFPDYGGGSLAVQPRPGGGYYVWTLLGTDSARFDSTTGAWTVRPKADNNPAYIIGNNLTDEAGNTWMYRWTNATLNEAQLDLRRPNGTWVNVSRPPFDVQFNSASAIRALGANRAVMADGGGTAYRFDNGVWTNLGMPYNNVNTYDVATDAAGNVWLVGIGGVARRDQGTGQWQRHRLTNAGSIESFVNDLALAGNGDVYSTANGAPGVGGMQKFDGSRWTGWNQYTYGLGYPWPFPTDNSEAVFVRANGRVVVNPMFNGVHEFDGTTWTNLNNTSDVADFAEDSLGRLWLIGEYYNLQVRNGGVWSQVGIAGWGDRLVKDPERPGSVYALTGFEIKRTDGVTSFSRTVEDFPELDPQSDAFHGMALDRNGVVWIGAATIGLEDSGALIRLDTNTGGYQMWRKVNGWPFPGQYVMPLAVSPDGRLWMQYDSEYLVAKRGLCWFDGSACGFFPAPSGGEPQWGGLPHAQIADCEVRPVPGGYELWMSCVSRGIAVLRVRTKAKADPIPDS